MRYELGAVLGSGGMAEVRSAVLRGAHGFVRRVAVKRLLPEVSADPTVVRMFLDEARIASRLHHAGIVSLVDYGEVDGAPFQVLELVDGRDAGWLAKRARELGVGVPDDVALHVVKEVAYALAYAHEARDDRGEPLGVVHRDVKPSNVLVSWGGDVKLGDFGIALARERCAQTTGRVARGTPGYMSPEQLVGATVGAATDIFALGCTLHGLLVGTSPLTGEAGRSALLAGQELPVSGALAEDVRAIVARAVKRDPDQRFASARAMAEALGEALARRLRTDAKSRLLEWLEPLQAPQQAQAPPTTEVLSPVADGARRFVRTLEEAPQVPTTVLESTALAGMADHELAPASTNAGAPPAPRTAPRKRSGRAWIFAAALLTTFLLFGVAVGGAFVGTAWVERGRAGTTDGGLEAIDAGTSTDASFTDSATPSPVTSAPSTEEPAEDDAGEPSSRAPRVQAPSSASKVVAQRGGRCMCLTSDGESLCPRELVRRRTEGCSCMLFPGRQFLCRVGQDTCGDDSWSSPGGFGGEPCVGQRMGQAADSGPVQGTTICNLCGHPLSYDGPGKAPCRGISSKAGGKELSGSLVCYR